MIGPLFADLPADAVAALAGRAATRSFAAGETLFREGDAAARLLVVRDGAVKIWRTSPAGEVTVLHRMGPGGVPGCMAVFRRIPYPATATAATDGVLLAWDAGFVADALRRWPALAVNALAVVGGRNADMLDRLHELASDPVERRVAKALLRLRDEAAGGRVVRATRQEVAEMAGTTLHSRSRCIGRWERAGIVRGGRGTVELLAPERLIG